MKKLITFLFLMLPFLNSGQTVFSKQVDSLKYVVDMPFICRDVIPSHNFMSVGCGDLLFWNVVKLREIAIPLLISKLDDTTTTEAVSRFGFYYRTADVAYTALEEIIHGIPTFQLLGVKFDHEGCGYCSYWLHLNKSLKNRQKFMEAVQKWYTINQHKLVWRRSNNFSSCDCSAPHPNGGHFYLEE